MIATIVPIVHIVALETERTPPPTSLLHRGGRGRSGAGKGFLTAIEVRCGKGCAITSLSLAREMASPPPVGFTRMRARRPAFHELRSRSRVVTPLGPGRHAANRWVSAAEKKGNC
jgi:hypothetical protein